MSANVVAIVTALVVGYFFLDPPWRWLILIPAAVIESLDIIVWLRWRKKKSTTGPESLVGATGRVVSIEGPHIIMVQARGQLWQADVDEQVNEQDEVVVTGIDGIRLKVAPAGPSLGTELPAS